jgi:two-component system response regulator MprA
MTTHHSTARTAAHPARILVVDDNQALSGLHAEILEMEGYEVVTANDGVDALERLASGEFDLVLTDRFMPLLDGASMILALRSAGSRIPVVMVSGSLVQSPLPPGVAREVSAALPKPARLDEMVAAVAQALKSNSRVDPSVGCF